MPMQNRTLLLVVALGAIGLAILWRETAHPPSSTQHQATWAQFLSAAQSIPAARPPTSSDTLSDREALRRLDRLYRLQADLMRAQSRNDDARIEAILHTTVRTLHASLQFPNLVERPRFRRVFRALTREYEHRYGVPDTLRLPNSPVSNLRDDLVASVNRRAPASVVDALPADLRTQHSAVPLTMNRPTRTTIAFLLRNKKRYLYPWLRRASTYFPMIEQIFAEENVPDELKYLAIAESGLDPHAQSRAQAAGIWQFVAKTGRRYGLSIDPWVDERLDPEKSTRAAARLLKDLHRKFGDWQLALAGYNCDPGVVQYHVQEYRDRTGQRPSFWDIYEDLPEETRNYVPLFTATAVIISNPAAFDLKRVQAGPQYAFDYVPVDRPLPIDQVATLADVPPSQIRVLNPELRSDRLPPSKKPYYVRLPYGTYKTFAENLDARPREQSSPKLQHVVQAGETAGRIARRYHVKRSVLLSTNGDGYPAQMSVGERLTIPEKTYEGNARVADGADRAPIRVRYGSRTVRPIGSDPSDGRVTATLSSSSRPAR
ncbi:MAG: lytic transglycosylase [Bacteroidetes bacterium SW_9_63_38]|nr:MAG: lytic transglycosylase [Bacteroidetes bacterium SW_9_63_38]